MRIQLDKIASCTVHLGLSRQVVVTPEVRAEPGAVVAARLLDGLDVTVENPQGRMMKCREGDVIAGVLGRRQALRGFHGDIPDEVGAGDVLHLLNRGGVIGRCPDGHPELGTPPRVEVIGSVVRFSDLERQHGEPANIFPGPVALADPGQDLGVPVVFVVGTTMHAGKTAAACAIVRGATTAGQRVVALKVTGVALRRDTLEMQDYGAVSAVSFSDVGFPSTIDVDVLGGRRAKVLCLRAYPDPALIALHDAVRSAARRVGIMPERRRFHPHVTISRFGGGLGAQEMARLGAFLEGMGDWALPESAVSHFSLFESILTPERAIHQPMATYPLAGLFNPGR